MSDENSPPTGGRRRYQCKWCNGSGRVASGAQCISCGGKGWYERPPHSNFAIRGAVFGSVLGVVSWWLGGSGWSSVLDGLSVFFSGVVVISFAMWLRGPEEEGWDWLMLLGSLLSAGGLISIPIMALLA